MLSVNGSSNALDVFEYFYQNTDISKVRLSSNEENFLDEFMNQKFVDVAIKDPLKGDFKLNNISCSAPNILKQYLYRQKTCPEYKEFKFTNNLLQTIKNTLHKFQVSETQISQSVKQYEDWYKEWQKQNIPQLIPDKMQKNEIEEELLDKYVKENTTDKGILLKRKLYGIVAQKG